jgi:dihydroorotate dehydrogenase
MLAERVAKGDDYYEAVEKADKFADIIAKNKKLPTTPPKPKNAIEQTVCYIEQVASVKREHPEVWDLVIGGISGLLGGFVVNRAAPNTEELSPAEIDFDNIK